MLTLERASKNKVNNTPLVKVTTKTGRDKIIYVDRDAIGKSLPKEFHLSPGERLEPLLDIYHRNVAYAAGQSGSGKTTYAVGVIERFLKVNQDMPFLFFSRMDARDDPAFSKYLLKRMIQIPLNESIIDHPIQIEELRLESGSMILFDDVGCFNNPQVKKAIDNFMIQIMEVGRKLNINMFFINHNVIPSEKVLARVVANEITSLTVFPRSTSVGQLTYMLKTHFGFSSKEIKDLLALPSRWVTILRNYPTAVIYEKGIYLL